MKLFFINFLKEFRSFAFGTGKNILFVSLFYSLWFVIHYISSVNFELKNFNGRMIGIATIHAYDVNARVSLFYDSLAILLAGFFLFNLLGFMLSKIKPTLPSSNEVKIVNYCSLAGMFFFLLAFFGCPTDLCLELVYFLHKLMLAALIIKAIKGRAQGIPVSLYTIIISVSIALYFVASDLLILSENNKMPDFWLVTFTLAVLLIIAIQFFISSKGLLNNKTYLLTYSFVPLAFAPLMSLLKDEVFLVFTGNKIHANQFLIYIILLALIIFFIILRFRKASRNSALLYKTSQRDLVALRYFPILIFSFLCYNVYSYYIQSSTEMFEAGNKYLPIMEFSKWGVVPIFEKFNSHLLNDFFFSSIYTFFNGMHGNEIELYDFINEGITGLLFYYLIYFITRNAYVSLFAILFYPFYSAMCPTDHAFIIFSIFILFKLTEQKPQLKNYLLFFVGILLLIFWKIDIGFAAVMIMPLVFLFNAAFNVNTKPDLKLCVKAFAIVGGLFLILLACISFSRNINVFEKAKYALNYLSSSQTYGYTVIGLAELTSYKMHYFIFPFICLVILVSLIFRYKSLYKSRRQRLAYLSLLVICLYYFINFQRGLVRHSLYEGTDSFTSSFAYIILSGSVFVFLYKKTQVTKYILFSIISFFTLISFKYPSIKGPQSVFNASLDKIQKSVLTEVNKVTSRTLKSDKDTSNINLIRFLRSNLKDDETFIDFAGFPMLYYYTQKTTPSYFYQNPICSHNDFLQERFVEDLKAYKAPYLLFSFWQDPTYYPPNSFVYYKISEYLFQNYQPYLIIDNFRIWKKNNFQRKDTVIAINYLRDHLEDKSSHVLLNRLSYIWGSYDKALKTESILFKYDKPILLSPNLADTIQIPKTLDRSSGNTVVLTIKCDADTLQRITLGIAGKGKSPEANIIFDMIPSKKEEKYAVRISSSYKWYSKEIDRIILTSQSGKTVRVNHIQITKAK